MSQTHRAEFGWPGGDNPGALGFSHEIAAPLRVAIGKVAEQQCSSLGEVEVIHALNAPEGAVGRYCVRGAKESVFARVSRRWGKPELEQAITGYLKSSGCSVNHLEVAGAALEFEGETYRLDIRQLIEGRHFDGSLEDLRSLAGELAKCHAALRSFPQAAEVCDHAAKRFIRLDQTRRKMDDALKRHDWGFFSEDNQWAIAHREWLQALVDQFEPEFHHHPTAQCLHAQIHRANIIFKNDDGRPVLVDWEEAVQTFAPVSWDLAYFVQRFCLYDDPASKVIRERLTAVRMAYGSWTPGIAEMMQQLAWMSIATIVGNREMGAFSNPAGEYQKFVRLECQAREYRSVINGDLLAS